MQLNHLIEGLQILQRYFDDPNGHHVASDFDEICVYATDKQVSEEDVARLKNLHWCQPDAYEGVDPDYKNDDPPYDPDSGWSAFP